jgi:hypothetical protein
MNEHRAFREAADARCFDEQLFINIDRCTHG